MQRISITNPQNIIDGTAKKYYFKLRNTGGPKGDKGDKGDTGQTGPQGPQGDPCTVVVNSTATLEPGSNAYVTNTGSLSNAVLNFGIPKGDRGPQGAKGDKGDTGAQGETGPRGPQGERGTNATVYVGTTSTLNPGSQATVYNSGSDSSAVLNFGIPQGAKGDTGSQGPQGPQGPAGQNFAPTVVAELPTTGDSSKLYLTPKAHTTSTATGNPITATVTEQAGKIESLKLDGDTYQQTYTGKNLLNAPDAKVVGGEMTCTTVESNHFSCSGTVRESWGFNIVFTRTTISTIPAGNYVLSISKALAFPVSFQLRATSSGSSLIGTKTISAGSTSETFTLSEAANIFTFWSPASQNTEINDTFTVQIELGSTATPYEPYVGGQPSPNPDYPQPIQTVTGEQTVEIVGKNLFDKTKVTNGYYIDENGTLQASANFGYSDYIAVVGGETYSYSGSTNSAWNAGKCAWYDSNKNFISPGSFGLSGQLTAPANASYFRTTIRIAESSGQAPYLDTYQLEYGSTVTAYAPFTGATDYTLDLGPIELCKLGTYQDYIYKDGDDWKVHKATGKKVLNGSESYVRFVSNNIVRFIAFIDGSINTTTRSDLFRTTHFHYLGAGDEVGGAFLNASNIGLMFGANDESVDQFKGWLRSNNVTLYFVLATPTDTTITDQTLIAQLEAIRTAALENGANTITNTATGSNLAGDMEIGYYGYNPTNRYDKWIWLDLNNNYEQIGS